MKWYKLHADAPGKTCNKFHKAKYFDGQRMQTKCGITKYIYDDTMIDIKINPEVKCKKCLKCK